MKVVVSIVVVLAITTMVMVEPGQAINCQQVASCLSPCLAYLTGQAKDPGATCCNGVQTLKSSTPTTADRRAACECMKNVGSHYDIKEDLAWKLPGLCGVQLTIPITKNVNCNR